MAKIRVRGHKLYRNLWVQVDKVEYEMEGQFAFPEKELTEAQLKILNALLDEMGGIDIADDGTVTPAGAV
jgi:hypothetical protein